MKCCLPAFGPAFFFPRGHEMWRQVFLLSPPSEFHPLLFLCGEKIVTYGRAPSVPRPPSVARVFFLLRRSLSFPPSPPRALPSAYPFPFFTCQGFPPCDARAWQALLFCGAFFFSGKRVSVGGSRPPFPPPRLNRCFFKTRR